jgi:hypothetical protein
MMVEQPRAQTTDTLRAVPEASGLTFSAHDAGGMMVIMQWGLLLVACPHSCMMDV